jgi:hypothetical protein
MSKTKKSEFLRDWIVFPQPNETYPSRQTPDVVRAYNAEQAMVLYINHHGLVQTNGEGFMVVPWERTITVTPRSMPLARKTKMFKENKGFELPVKISQKTIEDYSPDDDDDT